ncbi:zinc finger, CCHC-type containing protein [Tanacetum coccineum]
MTNEESVKDMTSKFDKLAMFEGQDFRRWQKKMHFLLTTLKVVYVLSTPSPVWSENKTLEATRKRMKWENDDYICHGHILNFMSDSLFDIYQNVESVKALWESLESKYMAEDSFCEEEGLRNQELDNNPKGKNQIGSSSVNMVEGDGAKNSNNNKNKRKFKSGDDKFANKKATVTCWKCNKMVYGRRLSLCSRELVALVQNGSKDHGNVKGYNSDFMQNFYNVLHYVSVISDAFYVQDDEVAWWVDSGATSHVCKDLRWFQVCKLIKDGSFVKIGNVATKPIKGIGRVLLTFTSGKTLCLDNLLYVPGIRKNLVSEIVLNKCGYKQVLESDKISTIRLLLALAAIHVLVIHQMDVKTAFLNGDLDEEIHMKQPKGFVIPRYESKCVYSKFDASSKGVIICLYVDNMLIFGTDQDQVNKTKELLSSNFDMKDLGEAEVILVYTPVDPTVKFRPNKGTLMSQLEYSRAIGCLMYAMISTRPDIDFAIGKLSRYTSNPSVLLGKLWKDIRCQVGFIIWRGHCYKWLGIPSGGGAISWASKKHTCITSSTMEFEFVALAAAGNEAEWLRNLVYEIPLWPKLMSTISIRCDSAATLAKAYIQVYNGKSRHLGVENSMIREFSCKWLISVEFVRTQLNLADHLTKGLARDLVRKVAIGMCLKST